MGDADSERYQVLISSAASVVLGEQAAYLAVHAGEEYARRHVAAFESATRSLQTFPSRRRFLEDPLLPPSTYRGLLFDEHYLIIYTVGTAVVHINLVVDCRQDYACLLQP